MLSFSILQSAFTNCEAPVNLIGHNTDRNFLCRPEWLVRKFR